MIEVLETSKTKLSSRLVMLALADNGSDDTRLAYPSIRTIARKANVSERTVQMSLKECVELGELEIAVGAAPHGCNVFRFVKRGGADSAPGVQPLRGGGAECSTGGGAKFAPEPSGGETSMETSIGDKDLVLGNKETLFPTDLQPSPEKERKSCAKKKERDKARCTQEEAEEFAVELQMPRSDGEAFFYKCEAAGWIISGKKVLDWKMTFRTHKSYGWLASQGRNQQRPLNGQGANGHAAPAQPQKSRLTNTEKRAIFKANGGRDEDNPY